ncbi:hypothetical protein Tco_0386269 [Tanacetum coccineum]
MKLRHSRGAQFETWPSGYPRAELRGFHLHCVEFHKELGLSLLGWIPGAHVVMGFLFWRLVCYSALYGPLMVRRMHDSRAVSGVPGDGSRVRTHDHNGSEAPDEAP